MDAIVRVILNKMFTRKELQRIRNKALDEACLHDANINWVQAYFKLANAADHLDAMLARSEEKIHSPVG